MRRWKPQAPIVLWIAVLLLLLVSAGLFIVGRDVARQFSGPPESWPITLDLFWRVLLLLVLLIAEAALLYRVIAAATLSYSLDRNGLYISWLGNRAVIPLEQIQTIEPNVSLKRMPLGPLQAVGNYWGRARTTDGREAFLFSTRAPRSSLAIHTSNAVYAISPADREAFVQDLEQRRNLGATTRLSPTIEPGRMFLYAFWNDRTVRWLLLLAFVINLLVVAVLMARYPQLASTVQMRFNSSGQVAELRPRHEILFLPLAAFALSLLNIIGGLLLYRNQRVGARLLQGASVLVQVLFSVAIITIIR